jgi:hypothetical protein
MQVDISSHGLQHEINAIYDNARKQAIGDVHTLSGKNITAPKAEGLIIININPANS